MIEKLFVNIDVFGEQPLTCFAEIRKITSGVESF